MHELWQTVGPGAEVLAAVERGPVVGRLETVVCPAVDHESIGRQRGRERARLAVRQRKEDDVMACEHLGRRLGESQRCERTQVWLRRNQRFAGVRERGDRLDVEVGMCCEQPQNFTTRITGGSGDGNRERRHGSTLKQEWTEAGAGDGWLKLDTPVSEPAPRIARSCHDVAKCCSARWWWSRVQATGRAAESTNRYS